MGKGNFIISLDFELHWGVTELWKTQDRKDYFETTRTSIPLVLELFKKYQIHATWATVGFLFAKNKEQLLAFCPVDKPKYINKSLSNYNLIENNSIGNNEIDDQYHYATSLIEQIITTPNQELATHTFSHFYCNEQGQTKEQFDADLKAAQSIAKENFNLKLESLVFPRNQFNQEYLSVAKQNGIKVVRSNPNVWFWKSNAKWMALSRAFDTLFSISKTVTFNNPCIAEEGVLLLPASRFLRPFTEKERKIQKIKIKRIKVEMTLAAQKGRCYHLWWHPHNFGYSLQENLTYLEEILVHFENLKNNYGFSSKSMIEMY